MDNINFPIGQSGIFLQGVRGEFGLDPVLVGAGLTATAGLQTAVARLWEGRHVEVGEFGRAAV